MKKLVIFGVGLIGGSVAMALKEARAVEQIVGVGRHPDHLQKALELGVIDQAESNVESAIQHADVILLATPVAQTPTILSQIQPYLAANTVVTDAGSTKSDVVHYASVSLAEKSPQFVPGHPIAGAEKSGVTAAKADLFQGKNVVLTPSPYTNDDATARIVQLWQLCGARVMQMSAEQHDQIFAAVSHLPHLLAFALVDELANRPNAEQLFAFAASGFRDFTRIAGSHPEMWRDISLANKEALLAEISQYQVKLDYLKSLLAQENADGLFALLAHASAARTAWGQRH